MKCCLDSPHYNIQSAPARANISFSAPGSAQSVSASLACLGQNCDLKRGPPRRVRHEERVEHPEDDLAGEVALAELQGVVLRDPERFERARERRGSRVPPDSISPSGERRYGAFSKLPACMKA